MTLEEFFKDNGKVALAFSGGVDSAFLLYAAFHAGADVCAYYVKTPFQPRFELEDAKRLADELGASLRVLEADVLSSPEPAAFSQLYHAGIIIQHRHCRPSQSHITWAFHGDHLFHKFLT